MVMMKVVSRSGLEMVVEKTEKLEEHGMCLNQFSKGM